MLRGEFRMTSGGPAVIGQSILSAPVSEAEEMETRFGRIAVQPKQSIYFPTGLLGMPDRVNYCLTHFPSEKMARFKLLQSLDDAALSFITLPVDLHNPIIEAADLEQAVRDLDMTQGEVAVLLMVTVHRESGAARLSVNARAPVLVDVARRVAAQYVFPHTKYLIRQPLSL
ncbi:MAG: flagellar assembly protein FliW [Alphaproteobacteria bacterium]|nr:flagellar assembly protein FliW [Alphaproteobacteria bacterium]